MSYSEELVKRKGSGGIGASSVGYGAGFTQTAPLESLYASSIQGKGQDRLKEALKGVGLPCGVCGTAKSDVTLEPCQHKCVCSTCSVKVTQCPLCDEEVKDKVVTGAGQWRYKKLMMLFVYLQFALSASACFSARQSVYQTANMCLLYISVCLPALLSRVFLEFFRPLGEKPL